MNTLPSPVRALLLTSLFVSTTTLASASALPPYLHAPSVTTYARHNPTGLTILPTGRYLKPVGRHLPLARWPHGLALSPDGKTLFIASEGVGQFVTDWDGPQPLVTSFPAGEKKTNAGGAASRPAGRTL